ncbi:hypothetical protein DSOL_5194 [Desulfosporosinus metallidurans]|uniref:Peptidase S8/S53 domain-containing protein n=1 Tax=Desulfosporosinus metallidurans TaxID=1888891 RepID=A0A1Q8QEV6_9FIRM|nr:hypothetical protein DSOL_5194 [Desulfosporosinus metallidurans]
MYDDEGNGCIAGNSFAAAYITGYIAKAIYDKEISGSKQVSDYLKTNL